MLIIKEYARPASLQEAAKLLEERQDAVVFGGGTYLRLGSREIGLAIDLSECGLKFIGRNNGEIEIGAMATFRDIETSNLLNEAFSGIISSSVSNILGVQFRNMVTAGGSVSGRYGFSDFITALLSLDCHVQLYKNGRISLEDFLSKKIKGKDILEKIIISDDGRNASFQTMRNSCADFAVLDAAVSLLDGKYRISVGVRPAAAVLAVNTMDFLAKGEVTPEKAEEAGHMAAEELSFGSDIRGSAQYRKEICKILVKRAVMEVSGCK